MLRRAVRATVLAVLLFGAAARTSSAASILLFDDNTSQNRPQAALASLGLSFTTANVSTFDTLLTGSTWDLVIMDIPSNTPGFANLIAYVAGGGRAILSYWDLDANAALQAAFGVTVSSSLSPPSNVSDWGGSSLFSAPNAVSTLNSWNDIWGDDGDRFAIGGSATIVAGFTAAVTANQGAIGIGNGGRTIVNGFLFDEIGDLNGINLIANEISYLLEPTAVPEPTSLLLLGTGACALVRRRMRQRKAAAE